MMLKTFSLRPCETISKRSRKKRRVVPKETEAEAEVAVEVAEAKEVVEAEAEMETETEEEEVNEEAEEEEVPVIMIDDGDHLDVKAFLSSKSRDFLVTTKGGDVVPIDSLEGKYVVVCCFLLPFDLDSIETSICRCIEALFAELSVQGIADSVKLVVVGKVAPGSRLANFDRFFRKLSLNCLAIPYSDSKSRDRVCETLELSEWDQPCLVVHPTGKVLQLSNPFLESYGAQSFPFTERHFHNIDIQDENVKSRIRSINSPISLSELLQCDSLTLISDGNMSIPTSDLDHTPVGIYLCFDGFRKGGFMFDLQDIHRKCREKGHKFEIVLIPVPFGRYSDPISFYDRIKKSALKNTTSSSWWTIPFSDKVCRSLWRLFYRGEKDELIILPRSGHPGDLYGRHMAAVYGADAYPFTRDVIVEKRLSELRSVTLEQLVGDSYMKMSDLRNKNVLLYLDYPRFDYHDSNLYKTVYQASREIKVMYPDSEVVFVPLEPVSSSRERRIKKTWPVLPQELCESVIKHIFKKDEGNPGGLLIPSIVAFGKDGKILSRHAADRLPGWTFSESESLFDDTLASEIFSDIIQRMY